jgi:predicted 3-demethylubiquinone-9 3-methyltransferase (glyoxalase superfamily)
LNSKWPNLQSLWFNGEAGKEFHGNEPGSVLLIHFEINGARFTALNGGPQFKLSEACSIVVTCDTQEELDFYWDRLSSGGSAIAQPCGWLKDKFGVSWQIIPSFLERITSDPDMASRDRAFAAIFQMKKLDFEAIRKAYGKPV